MATTSTAESPVAAADIPSTAHAWAIAVAVSAGVVAVVRWIVVHDRREYAIWPDEPAQLAVARHLGGGTRWNMDDHSVWRPLYGALISPVHWFTDDPVTVLRSALAVNALLGGAAAALLVVLLRRLTALGPWSTAVVAVLVSLSPAVLFTAEFVWSESLTLVLSLAGLLTLLRFHADPTGAHGVLAAVVAGLGFAAHSRLVPLVVVVVAVAVVALLRGRCDRRVASATIGVSVAMLLLVVVATDWVIGQLWDEPSDRNSPGSVIERLADPVSIGVAAVGQLWQLLVASLGFVAVGVWALARSGCRTAPGTAAPDRSEAAAPGGTRSEAILVLLVAGLGVALSAVFMADRTRADQLVYGRYNAVAVLPVVAVGVAACLDRPRPTRRVVAGTGVAIAATGIVLWLLRGDELSQSNGIEPMILGLQPFLTGESIPVVSITIVAAAITTALGLTAIAGRAPWWPAVGVIALAVLVVVGSVRTGRIIDEAWDDSGGASWYSTLVDDRLASVTTVDWYLPAGSTSTMQLMLAQFYVPTVEFRVVDDAVTPTGSSFVFASPTDDALVASTARLVEVSAGRTIGLWER